MTLENNLPQALSAAVSQDIVLRWLDQAHESLLAGPCAAALDYEGIDLFDAAISELVLTMLGVLRRARAQQTLVPPSVSPLRRLAFEWKHAFTTRWAAPRAAAPAASDILLWPRDITHTVVLCPVLAALEAQGVRAQMLTCHARTLRGVLERTRNVTYGPANWPGKLRTARREAAWRIKKLQRLPVGSLPDFAGRRSAEFESAVYGALANVIPMALIAAANFQAAVDATGARLIVVGNDLTVEGRTGCSAARLRGIPSAVLMHGTITGNPLNERHLADRIFVFGETHRRELLEMGVSAERIEVSGDPNLDGRPRPSGRIHPALEAQLGLRSGKPWVLVCTSGPGHRISHDHHQQVVASLARLADALSDVPIVIKLHRKDRIVYYEPLETVRVRRNVHVIPHGTAGFPADIYAWLDGASILLTGASTTAIEAMVMDVPVITLDLCGALGDIDFIQAGATLHVERADELANAVRQVIRGDEPSEERQSRIAEFLHSTYHSLDGGASQRVATSLCQLAKITRS